MTVDTMVNMIVRKWNLSGYGSQLDSTLAKQYLIDSVYQVEAVDCRTSNAFTVNGNDITFDDEPSDKMGMVYVYCTLNQLENAYIHGMLDDGDIGVTIKSNMESVSSSGSAKAHMAMAQSFANQYKNILAQCKISRLNNSPIVKIYKDSDYES